MPEDTTAAGAAVTVSSYNAPFAADLPPLETGELERLSVEYARTRDIRLRETLVHYHQRLVRSIVTRFMGSGESLDDLMQVGNIGLINALDRYDPSQGTRFSTYATPTILGEIRRHFRDKTSAIKVPRWLQELHHATRKVSQELTGQLGRSPTISEIAARLNVSEEEVLQALESGEAVNLLSLDAQMEGQSRNEAVSLMDLVGRIDRSLHEFESFGDLRTALDTLDGRERQVIALRFFEEMSQARIAERLNISQMHVSRLQQRALKRLREILTDEARSRRVRSQRSSSSSSRRLAADH